jgi:hypothetical protein
MENYHFFMVGLAWHGVAREGPGCGEKDAIGVENSLFLWPFSIAIF